MSPLFFPQYCLYWKHSVFLTGTFSNYYMSEYGAKGTFEIFKINSTFD